MAKASSKAKSKVREIEPSDKREVDLTKFKLDLSAMDVKKLIGNTSFFPFLPIETLTPTKTIGRGRTNLTLGSPVVFQTDATVPRATFNRRAQSSQPAAQMHFQPSGYGITFIGTYIMEFTIEALGPSTFTLGGNSSGFGTILNGGTKVLNGQSRVSLIFKDLPPSTESSGLLQQTSGGVWHWFSIQVRFPDLVISQ